ncbi:MAG TPA: LCP family protein [Actinokineospora sp.]|nr:LCP family protein [Actinokineospora sp.]
MRDDHDPDGSPLAERPAQGGKRRAPEPAETPRRRRRSMEGAGGVSVSDLVERHNGSRPNLQPVPPAQVRPADIPSETHALPEYPGEFPAPDADVTPSRPGRRRAAEEPESRSSLADAFVGGSTGRRAIVEPEQFPTGKRAKPEPTGKRAMPDAPAEGRRSKQDPPRSAETPTGRRGRSEEPVGSPEPRPGGRAKAEPVAPDQPRPILHAPIPAEVAIQPASGHTKQNDDNPIGERRLPNTGQPAVQTGRAGTPRQAGQGGVHPNEATLAGQRPADARYGQPSLTGMRPVADPRQTGSHPRRDGGPRPGQAGQRPTPDQNLSGPRAGEPSLTGMRPVADPRLPRPENGGPGPRQGQAGQRPGEASLSGMRPVADPRLSGGLARPDNAPDNGGHGQAGPRQTGSYPRPGEDARAGQGHPRPNGPFPGPDGSGPRPTPGGPIGQPGALAEPTSSRPGAHPGRPGFAPRPEQTGRPVGEQHAGRPGEASLTGMRPVADPRNSGAHPRPDNGAHRPAAPQPGDLGQRLDGPPVTGRQPFPGATDQQAPGADTWASGPHGPNQGARPTPGRRPGEASLSGMRPVADPRNAGAHPLDPTSSGRHPAAGRPGPNVGGPHPGQTGAFPAESPNTGARPAPGAPGHTGAFPNDSANIGARPAPGGPQAPGHTGAFPAPGGHPLDQPAAGRPEQADDWQPDRLGGEVRIPRQLPPGQSSMPRRPPEQDDQRVALTPPPSATDAEIMGLTTEMEAIGEHTQKRRRVDETLARFSKVHDELKAEEKARKSSKFSKLNPWAADAAALDDHLDELALLPGEQTALVAPVDEEPAGTRLQQKKVRKQTQSTKLAKVFVATMAALVFLATGIGWAFKKSTSDSIDHVRALDPDSASIQNAEAQHGDENFLLVGSDSREGAAAEDGVGDTNEVPGARSDTMMIAHIPADRSRVVVVSLPRDLEINRPDCEKFDPKSFSYTGETAKGHKTAKLNTAYQFGGPLCLTQVIQGISGLRITRFIGIDFNGFKGMVDAVDGVNVCVEKPMYDDTLNKWIVKEPGKEVELRGDQALDFVRARHVRGDVTSDYGRIIRQQRFLSSLLRKAMSANVLLDPGKLTGFASSFAEATFGDNINLDAIMQLGQSMQSLEAGRVTFITVPTVGVRNDNGNETLLKEPTAALFRAIINDQALPGEKPAAPAPAAGSPQALPQSAPLRQAQPVDPKTLKIQVLNGGNKTDNIARDTGAALTKLGYTLVQSTTGPPVSKTVVRYGKGNEAAAQTLASSVPGATLEETPSAGGALILILGPDFKGKVVAPTGTVTQPEPEKLPANLSTVNGGDVRCA